MAWQRREKAYIVRDVSALERQSTKIIIVILQRRISATVTAAVTQNKIMIQHNLVDVILGFFVRINEIK